MKNIIFDTAVNSREHQTKINNWFDDNPKVVVYTIFSRKLVTALSHTQLTTYFTQVFYTEKL